MEAACYIEYAGHGSCGCGLFVCRDCNAAVKQTACLCLLKLLRVDPKLISMEQYSTRIIQFLNDRNLVCVCVCTLFGYYRESSPTPGWSFVLDTLCLHFLHFASVTLSLSLLSSRDWLPQLAVYWRSSPTLILTCSCSVSLLQYLN